MELAFAPMLAILAVATVVIRQTWAACGLRGMTGGIFLNIPLSLPVCLLEFDSGV